MQHFLLTYGYAAVFLLSLLSSACIPIPSELTLLLAGALGSSAVASQHGQHPLSLGLVIVLAIVGSLCGATIAYVVGRTAGRAIVDRWGQYLLLSHADLDRSEAWFERRGEPAVLVGNFIPLVRAFISFPAGAAEMNVAKFEGFSAIGISIWVCVLTFAGYKLGDQYDKLTKSISWAGYVIAAVFIVAIAVFLWHRYQSVKKDRAARGQ